LSNNSEEWNINKLTKHRPIIQFPHSNYHIPTIEVDTDELLIKINSIHISDLEIVW